jgi:hypothetical protein
MNYDKLSRSLRYYYEKGIMQKVAGESLPSVVLTTWQHCENHDFFYMVRLRKKKMYMTLKDSYLSCNGGVPSITDNLNFLTSQAVWPTYTRNIEARARKHSCRGKAISVAHSGCVFEALLIQLAKRMRRILLSSVASLSLPYFSTLPRIRHDFRKKIIEHKMYILISSTIFCLKRFSI